MSKQAFEEECEQEEKRRTGIKILIDRKKKASRFERQNVEDLYGCPNSRELSEIIQIKKTEVLNYD